MIRTAIASVRSRVRAWRLRRSITRLEKARLRARIARHERIRIETTHPERETLPLWVSLRFLARIVWDDVALRFYPVALLRRRVGRYREGDDDV